MYFVDLLYSNTLNVHGGNRHIYNLSIVNLTFLVQPQPPNKQAIDTLLCFCSFSIDIKVHVFYKIQSDFCPPMRSVTIHLLWRPIVAPSVKQVTTPGRAEQRSRFVQNEGGGWGH